MNERLHLAFNSKQKKKERSIITTLNFLDYLKGVFLTFL